MLTSPVLAARTADEDLVACVRDGSDEAYEILVRRYRDRIAAHVRRQVFDSERAEDIVQDVFVSALRGLRSSDQEIVFRPWLYMIARNACIDHARRLRRNEEISVDSDEIGMVFDVPAGGASSTELSVLRKQELDDINQAFGGLPDSQHRVLVLRELEGLSYEEIGRRMRLTRSAVESMLSRARRTVKGQYDEIATGARCTRMRPVMVAVSHGLAGKRDRHTLARHVRHCRSCRHDALAVGLDEFVVSARRGGLRGGLQRAAGIFPLGWFLRRPDGPAGAVGGSSAEHGATAVQKLAAVVVAAAVAGGGGVVAHKSGMDLPVPKAVGSSGHDSAPGSAENLNGGQGAAGQGTPGHARSGNAGAPPPGSQRLPANKQVSAGQPAVDQPNVRLPGSPAHGSPQQGGDVGAGNRTQPSITKPTGTLPPGIEKKTDVVTKVPPGSEKKVDDVAKAPPEVKKKVDQVTKSPPVVKKPIVVKPPPVVKAPIVPKPPSGIKGTIDELTGDPAGSLPVNPGKLLP
jgi:RNA polymerase sigma factor (sigma-70 family)